MTGSRTLYYPYGEERWSASGGTLATDYGFTGQRREGFGLMDYNARFYDPALGRFISADTIVPDPGNPQALNRYSYVLNNPLMYVDPSGHVPVSKPPNPTQERFGSKLPRHLRSLSFPINPVGTPPATPAPTPIASSSGAGELVLPIKDPKYDNGYGCYPWNDDGSLFHHKGYDITSRSGDRTVYSMGSGEVVDVLIDTEDPDSPYLVRVEMDNEVYIAYVHISTTDLKVGDTVEANTVIGPYDEVGWATYPHLHVQFENPYLSGVDPGDYWPGGEPSQWEGAWGAPQTCP